MRNRKKDKKNKKSLAQAAKTAGTPATGSKDNQKDIPGGGKINQRMRAGQSGGRRRPPKTTVAIRGVAPSFSYAEVLKALRSQISLSELEIERSHIRKAASGGILIEISGSEKAQKAEKLKDRIARVLGSGQGHAAHDKRKGKGNGTRQFGGARGNFGRLSDKGRLRGERNKSGSNSSYEKWIVHGLGTRPARSND